MVEKIQNKKKPIKQNSKAKPVNSQRKKKQADDKSARIKKAQKTRKLLTWTILLGMFVSIAIFLLQSEMFKVCTIEITGNNQITQETILELSEINLNNNIFLANTIKAKNKISQNPYVKEVKINKILPDKIKIEIVEKQKVYILQIDNLFAYIDKEGYILEISETKIENLIFLKGYSTKTEEMTAGKTLNEDDLEILQDLEQILNSGEKNGINDKIASIDITNKNEYKLYLPQDKKIVYIGDTSNLATKMLRTKDILDKTIDKEGKIFVNGEFNEGFDPYFREEPNN